MGYNALPNEERVLASEVNSTAIFKDLPKFIKLYPSFQGKILGKHPDIMHNAINEGILSTLNVHTISSAVTYYVAGIDPSKGYFLSNPISLSEKTRAEILFAIAKHPEIIGKMYPAARILFFANLAQINSVKLAKLEGRHKLKKFGFPDSTIDGIENACVIKPHASKTDVASPFHWGQAWVEMAGIYFGANTDKIWLWMTSQQDPSVLPADFDEARATALVLVTDPRCNPFFASEFSYRKDLEQRTNQNLEFPYTDPQGRSYPSRKRLGFQFKDCAQAMITEPAYRGSKGEISDKDLEKMAKLHGLQSELEQTKRKIELELKKEHEEREAKRVAEQRFRAEQQRLAQEKAEQERLAKEKELKEQQEKADRERMELERREKESLKMEAALRQQQELVEADALLQRQKEIEARRTADQADQPYRENQQSEKKVKQDHLESEKSKSKLKLPETEQGTHVEAVPAGSKDSAELTTIPVIQPVTNDRSVAVSNDLGTANGTTNGTTNEITNGTTDKTTVSPIPVTVSPIPVTVSPIPVNVPNTSVPPVLFHNQFSNPRGTTGNVPNRSQQRDASSRSGILLTQTTPKPKRKKCFS